MMLSIAQTETLMFHLEILLPKLPDKTMVTINVEDERAIHPTTIIVQNYPALGESRQRDIVRIEPDGRVSPF